MEIWTVTLVEDAKSGNCLDTQFFLTRAFSSEAEAKAFFERHKNKNQWSQDVQSTDCYFQMEDKSYCVRISLQKHLV